MKKLVCVMAMSLLLWPACNADLNRASQNENNTAETARQQRLVYQAKIEAKLRYLDREVDELKTKLEQSKVDRKEYDQRMAELERKREVAHQKLEKLRTSSQAAWVDMKAGIDAALDDLESAYDKAASHFK
jgi:septal ring factor EnvC (AmiA/AmiB activator)